jgi:hypothetical protein
MTLDLLEQVAIATGRIIHGGTGQAIFGNIMLTPSLPGVVTKVTADGRFGLSGEIQHLFPELATQDYVLQLDLLIDSPQFNAGTRRLEQAITIEKDYSFAQPLDLGEIRLDPDPIILRGRVFNADRSGNGDRLPIENATVSLLTGDQSFNALTDETGRYSLGKVNDDGREVGYRIVEGATVECAAAGFKTRNRPLRVDFSQFVHEEYFYLQPNGT